MDLSNLPDMYSHVRPWAVGTWYTQASYQPIPLSRLIAACYRWPITFLTTRDKPLDFLYRQFCLIWWWVEWMGKSYRYYWDVIGDGLSEKKNTMNNHSLWDMYQKLAFDLKWFYFMHYTMYSCIVYFKL